MEILDQKVECLIIVHQRYWINGESLIAGHQRFWIKVECLIIGHQSLIRGFSNYKTPETLNQRVVSI